MQHHSLQPETGFPQPRVFLGGTCNGSLWRNNLIPLLNISYFNPVTENWTPEHQQEEQRQREICDYCLYTLTPKMTGVFSVAELVEDSVKRPEKTVLCLLQLDDGQQFTEHQWKSLEATAQLVLKNGAHVFYALSDVGLFLNLLLRIRRINGDADNADYTDQRGFSERDALRIVSVTSQGGRHARKIRVDPYNPRCPLSH